MAGRPSASSFKRLCKPSSLAATLSLIALVVGHAGCGHLGATDTGGTVILVDAPPEHCKKLGVVRGFGGSPPYAMADARARALQRGATHVMLGTPDLDVEAQIVTVVDATLFDCPRPGSFFPPTGYPGRSRQP